MSKLSRFKKAPAIKLPSKLAASKQRAQRNRFDSDSEEDDDFVKRPGKQSTQSLRSSEAFPTSTKEEVRSAPECSASASISEYFTAEQPEGTSQNGSPNIPKVKPDGDGVKASVKPSTRKEKLEVVETSCKSRPAKKNQTKSTVLEEKEDTQSSTSSLAVSSEPTSTDESSKVFCPFCMKKLGDKLTGTTHVKACAKNLPLEQVYEAIQLQEKQMKEWETLGLVYPGLASTAITKKPKGTSGRGRTGRNKNKPADSDLELAIALSVSLHEEVESRTTKENQFIIENGLENEIELAKVLPKCSNSENKLRSSKVEMPAPAPVVPTKRRGKKMQLEELPLYTVNHERRKEIIGDRVAKILDDCDSNEVEKFYVRDEVPKDIIGVPKRLIPLLNKNGDDCQDSSLWKLAESEPETPDKSFSVLELKELDALEPSFSSTTNLDNRKQMENESPSSSGFEDLSEAAEGVPDDKRWIPNKTIKECSSTKVEVQGPTRLVKQNTTTRKPASSLETRSCRFNSKAVQHLPPVIQDIARMLLSRVESDIILYGREEKPIKCHRFILLARCPKILDEVIIEENSQKVTRHVIPLISYSHKAVSAFLWYLYTGSVESDEELRNEVEEIASTYGVKILKPNEETFTKQIHESCSVEIQTDRVQTEDIFTMTEDCSSAEKSPLKNVTFNDTLNDVINTSCEDLFKTYDHGDASPSSPTATTETAPGNKLFRNSDADNSDKSVDLFEDLDDGWEGGHAEKSKTSFTEPIIERRSRRSEKFTSKEKLRQKQSVSEDEDYLRELETPISSFIRDSIVSQKKRSRSVSPVLDDSGNMYTATQVAEILQTRRDGGDVIDCMNKAIKKQKLDFCGDELNEFNDSSDNELGQLSLKELVENHSFVKTSTSGCLNNCSVKRIDNNDVHQNGLQCSTPKLNSSAKSIRKSVSTPNLSTKSPNRFSPFYNHQMQNEFEADDPFADDSLFAHIPDEAFSPKSNFSKFSSQRSRTTMKPATSQLSRTPSRSKNKLSPRNLISEDDLSSSIENGQSRMKGPQKRKGKPTAPKIKLPSRKAPNKVNVSQPPPVDQSVAIDDGKSPMLNYSLIDTPILKEELRRYGIKPLPRSKAKVLLRHIYKETHK